MRDNGFTLQTPNVSGKANCFYVMQHAHDMPFSLHRVLWYKTISVTWLRLGISYFGSKTLTKRRNPRYQRLKAVDRQEQ